MSSRFPFRSSVRRSTRLAAGGALLLATSMLAASADAQPRHACGLGCGQAAMRMHRHGGPAPRGGGQSIDRLLAQSEALELTEAQQTKLREIRKSTPRALMPKRQVVEEAQLELQDLMAQEKSTSADLKRAHDKLVKARADLQAAQFDLRMQVYDVLTPEQRVKIRDTVRRGARDGERQRMRLHRFGAIDPEDPFEIEVPEGPVFERF